MIGYGQLVRQNKNYRNLWLGQIVSMLGDWFNLIASAALVAQFTQSGLAVGALFVVRMLAPFVASLFAGVIADRYNRRNVLIAADIARAVTAFSFLLIRDPSQAWLIFALSAIQMGISGIFNPTHNAFLPDITSKAEVGTANALSSATWSVMLAVGAALGGLVSGYFGMYVAFAIDGLTFLVSAGFLAAIHFPKAIWAEARPKTGVLSEYVDGLRYLRNHPAVMFIATNKVWVTLTTWAGIQVSMVRLAELVFPIGAGGSISLGLMFAAQGLGTGVGPLVLRRLTRDDPVRMRIMIAISFGLSVIGLTIAANLSQLWIFLLGLTLTGVGGGSIWVFTTQLLFQLVPAEVRGRVMAVELGIFTLGSALSAAVVGIVIDAGYTERHILLGSALVAVVPALLWMLQVVRSRRARSAPAIAS